MLELPRTVVDQDHLAAYREVTGFSAGPALPVTYPHVLAFPLHLDLMSDPSFPLQADGIVHLSNTITQHQPLPIHAELAIEVTARPERPHPKGTSLRRDQRGPRRRRGGLDRPDHPAQPLVRHTTTAARRPAAGPGARPGRLSGTCAATSAAGTPRVRRPEPDPPVQADRAGVRLPAPDRARHVGQGRLRSALDPARRRSCPMPSPSAPTSASRCCSPPGSSSAHNARQTIDFAVYGEGRELTHLIGQLQAH